MPQVTISKPLTFYVDTPSVRVFQTFAGESLEKLDEYEAWDIITVLSQSTLTAHMSDTETIDIHSAMLTLSSEFKISTDAKKCLKALHGFPVSQMNVLMIGILSVAFEV